LFDDFDAVENRRKDRQSQLDPSCQRTATTGCIPRVMNGEHVPEYFS
jgi:hypothetical protein